jgi:hypothetical protein
MVISPYICSMKLPRIFLAITAVLALSSCDSSTGPAENMYDTQGSLAPYAIGDKYAFQIYVNDWLGDTAHYEVIKDTIIDGETWQIHKRTASFHYTLENSPEPLSTRELIRIDANGLTHHDNVYGVMSIDRSRAFDPTATDSVGMYLNDTTNVRVTAGTFRTAANFRSNYSHGDRSIYAPGVGMIYRQTSNSYMELLYAVIAGKRYGLLP